jgi:hypothetical protein
MEETPGPVLAKEKRRSPGAAIPVFGTRYAVFHTTGGHAFPKGNPVQILHGLGLILTLIEDLKIMKIH